MKEKTTVTIRLDSDDLEKLKKIAEDENEPQTCVIRRMIRERFNKLPLPPSGTNSRFISKMLRTK